MKKFAKLEGEYFIIDGFSEYADGDVGDVNHDGIVLSHLYGIISDVEVDDETQALIDSGQLTEEQQENIDESYPGLFYQYGGNYEVYDGEAAKMERAFDGNLNVLEEREVESTWPGYLSYQHMPKDYAVEHLGWIRCLGNNFEAQVVTEEVLSQIVGHCHEVSYDEADEELCINEHSTGAYLCFMLSELSDAVQLGRGLVKFRQKQRVESQGQMY